MTDITYVDQSNRLNFNWISEVIFHPSKAFQKISSYTKPIWLTPLLILSVIVLLNVLAAGRLKNQAASMGEITYPPDFQYYTPEQQAQYMQAIQSKQGPVFTYVLPAIASIIGVWLSWLIFGGLLHLVTTLFGGRGSTMLSMNIVAWSSIPLALRELIQLIYLLIAIKMIDFPGLSGFGLTAETGWPVVLNIILRSIDIYLIWQILLMILGVRISTGLNKTKATLGVLITVLMIFILQTGFSYLTNLLGTLEITRPFFF